MKVWKKLAIGAFVGSVIMAALLVALVVMLLVPPASERTVTAIEATFSHSGTVLDADPEDDLFIYVEEYAAPFRINRAAQHGFLDQQFVDEVQPGDQIEILAFKRYLPRDPENGILLGSIPTWTVLHEGASYIPDRLPAQLP